MFGTQGLSHVTSWESPHLGHGRHCGKHRTEWWTEKQPHPERAYSVDSENKDIPSWFHKRSTKEVARIAKWEIITYLQVEAWGIQWVAPPRRDISAKLRRKRGLGRAHPITTSLSGSWHNASIFVPDILAAAHPCLVPCTLRALSFLHLA